MREPLLLAATTVLSGIALLAGCRGSDQGAAEVEGGAGDLCAARDVALELEVAAEGEGEAQDPCIEGMRHCDPEHGFCRPSGESYECGCVPGWRLDAAGRGCEDIDECAEGADGCDRDHGICRNVLGGVACDCAPGWRTGDDGRTCEDIDECADGSAECDPVHGICRNTAGSFECRCRRPWVLDALRNDGRTCSIVDWVFIPGGYFVMGEADLPQYVYFDNRAPPHEVFVPDFYLSRTEITGSQYMECVLHGPCEDPADMDSDTPLIADGPLPVSGISFEAAVTFSSWANGRLPSESEWEYAARSGGQSSTYPWGNRYATCDRAVIWDPGWRADSGQCGFHVECLQPNPERWCEGNRFLAVPCSKPLGNSDHGICDLAGNVSEWVQDVFHDSYDGAPGDGSSWEVPASDRRVVRGGNSATSSRAVEARARAFSMPDAPFSLVGFRPARSVP